MVHTRFDFLPQLLYPLFERAFCQAAAYWTSWKVGTLLRTVCILANFFTNEKILLFYIKLLDQEISCWGVNNRVYTFLSNVPNNPKISLLIPCIFQILLYSSAGGAFYSLTRLYFKIGGGCFAFWCVYFMVQSK